LPRPYGRKLTYRINVSVLNVKGDFIKKLLEVRRNDRESRAGGKKKGQE
jgi:hypothetical protein